MPTDPRMTHGIPALPMLGTILPDPAGDGVVLVARGRNCSGARSTSAVDALAHRPAGRRLLFLKSWNEWAEGNHLEPDLRFGAGFLQVIAEALGVAWAEKTPLRGTAQLRDECLVT